MSSSRASTAISPWVKYYAIINAGTLMLFALDKVKAKIGLHRISEKDLCIAALLGGWPTGIVAIFAFNHKLKKKSFLAKFALAAVTNLALTYYIQKP